MLFHFFRAWRPSYTYYKQQSCHFSSCAPMLGTFDLHHWTYWTEWAPFQKRASSRSKKGASRISFFVRRLGLKIIGKTTNFDVVYSATGMALLFIVNFTGKPRSNLWGSLTRGKTFKRMFTKLQTTENTVEWSAIWWRNGTESILNCLIRPFVRSTRILTAERARLKSRCPGSVFGALKG